VLRRIVLAASVLPALQGQLAISSPPPGTMTPLGSVVKAPRVAEIEFFTFEFRRSRPAHGRVFLFGPDGASARARKRGVGRG
jgi:hypothetical protein